MPAQYGIPAAWTGSMFTELDLPSGGKILAKKIDLQDIVAAGLLDEFDTLSPVVEEKVVGPAQGKKPNDRPAKKLTKAQQAKADAQAARSAMKDKSTTDALIRILSLLLPELVVEPKIHVAVRQDDNGAWVRLPFSERDPEKTYVDSVPFPDQMHIFDWAMAGLDTEKLQQFRQQSVEDLGAVEPQQKPSSAAE